MANGIVEFIKKLSSRARDFLDLPRQIKDIRDLTLFHQTKLLQSNHPNPLNKFGKKCFSQADEDGITLEILRRIDQLSSGVYAEFGVGDGTENNTLILSALGWKGFWVGGENLKFDVKDIKSNTADKNSKTFSYLQAWITLDNIVELANRGLSEIGAEGLDVISLDLDGNDIYFIEKLLNNGFRPKLYIVEYNAKFPPPIEFSIRYDSQNIWKYDDYFGASLSSFDKLFSKFNYRLVCCNSHTGSNAFFIDVAYAEFFADIPADINQIYVEPRYYLYNKYGHVASVETIKRVLSAD
jgi:hypothetical protein